MFLRLLAFEIKNRLFRTSSIVYFSLYFALAFFCASAFGGAFKGVNVSFGLSLQLALNSPIGISCLISIIGYFGLLIIAPIFGQSINQDFETGFHQVLFATPLRKSTYFLVRYAASFIVVLLLLLSIGLGIWCVTKMPFIDRTLVLKNRLWFYVAPYLSIVVPNILLFGALFLAIVSKYKKMAAVYVASVVIFMGLMISNNFLEDLDNRWLSALLDASGMQAIALTTRYWSLSQQSTQVVPLAGYFLYNRLLWGGLGALFLALAYLLFRPFTLAKEKMQHVIAEGAVQKEIAPLKSPLSPNSWKLFWHLSFSEFRQCFFNLFFLVLLLCCFLYVFAISDQIGRMYGTATLPVTYHVLEVIGGIFSLFIAMITTYCAGELVWKDRELRTYELIDATPVANRFLYLSKLLSLSLIQLFLLFLIFISCILLQLSRGYTHLELALYVKCLLFYTLPAWLLLTVFALFAQTVARSKIVGHAIVILYFIGTMWLPFFGFDHHLYLMGVLPKAAYSDMNGFGTSFWRYSCLGLYWSAFYLFLALSTIILWRRGAPSSKRDRWREYKWRIRPIHAYCSFATLSLWGLLGAFIYYNTNRLNNYKTTAAQEGERVDYERTYASFKKSAHPDLIVAKLQIDLFPENQSMQTAAVFTYCNSSEQPITTFLLNLSPDVEVEFLEWSKPVEVLQEGFFAKVYALKEPLAPEEEIALHFRLAVNPKGFKNEEFSKKIVGNGTFFHSFDFFPVVGYLAHCELNSGKSRRKYGLAEKDPLPDVNDQEALQKTYISQEGTWIEFEATVSTSLDQIALVPGYLQKEWQEGGRRYFHYKMDRPILPFYAILSARYEVVRDQWNDVAIEVYHHSGHTSNIPRMIQAVKSSLEYYTKNFSPYQFKQLRILEFPRYQLFAQAFPNTIPYSEGLGFIAKVDAKDPESIDYPFYVTAHETAHQWWAHQVISGNVQGATMLSESLAQYSALMVMEKEFGPQQMKKFLKYELDGYLHDRSCAGKRELSLALTGNEPYIHYKKGSLVFYALKDYLGEELVNQVLSAYIEEVAFQKPPFTRAVDLVERFREAAPPALKYLIEDLFETITFYDNRTDRVQWRKNNKGKYEVEIHTTNRKWRLNRAGLEEEIPMEEFIDIGVFAPNGELQYLQKHRVTSGENSFHIEVTEPPAKAGIDPFHKLIGRISEDNLLQAKTARS